jgi:hypothetical protein
MRFDHHADVTPQAIRWRGDRQVGGGVSRHMARKPSAALSGALPSTSRPSGTGGSRNSLA